MIESGFVIVFGRSRALFRLALDPTAMFWDVATPVLLDQDFEMGKLLIGNDNPHETSVVSQ